MKSYVYTTIKGDTFKVRFYKTGGVTIVDKNGEHEVGMWRVGLNDDCGYYGKFFEKEHTYFQFKQKDLAYDLLNAYLWKIEYRKGY